MNSLQVQGSMAKYHNKAIMTTQIKIKDLLDHYKIDKSVNRDLGYHRLSKITNYLESMEEGNGIFLPAIVLSFREDPSPFWNRYTNTLSLPSTSELIVLDGQHRIKGLERYLNTHQIDSGKRLRILESHLTAQVYFGLSKEDERRLFTDINTNGKKVSRSLITKFDNRDILNVLVRELHNTCDALKTNLTVEFEKSRIVKPQVNTFITSVRLKKFIKILFFGFSSSGTQVLLNKKHEQLLTENYDEIFAFLNKFFDVLAEALPDYPGDVRSNVLGHEAMQTAIALYFNSSIILDNQDTLSWLDSWQEDVDQLSRINWSVKNPLWDPYLIVARKGSSFEYKQFIDVNNTSIDLKNILDRKIHGI